MGKSQLLKTGIMICAGLAIGLGAVVLLGWYTHNQTLIQVLPIFVPMQYNTALGFLLCGAGMMALLFGRKRLAAVFSGLAVTIGFLTLLQYIFGADFGIDQLVMKHYILVKTSHPGRMAPNTALCFTLTGIGLLLLSRPGRSRAGKRTLATGVAGSIVVALGAVAFSGYLSGLETAYGWGKLTRMAVHTALGFVLLGAGMFLLAWHRERQQKTVIIRWIAAPIGIGVSAAVLMIWQSLAVHEPGLAPLPTVVLTVGLLMSLLLVLSVHLSQKLWRRVMEHRKKAAGEYESIIRTSIDSFWVADSRGRIIDVNDSYCRSSGYSREELLDMNVSDVEAAESPEDTARHIQKVIRKGNDIFETKHRRKDGTIIDLEVSAHFSESDGGKFFAFLRDITERRLAWENLEESVKERTVELETVNQSLLDEIKERRHAEEEQKILEEQLRQAHKMEAIGILAGGIAHNFNNVLGAILGYTELAMLDLPQDSVTRSNLEQAMAASHRAKDMVQQILAFSRKEEKDKKPVKLNEIMRESLTFLQRSLPSTIEFRSYIAEQLPLILANPTQVQQVIMNLCTNSAHAMKKKGGILDISLREIDIQPGTVGAIFEIDTFKQKEFAFGTFLQLTVSDTGHGMDKKTIDRIFEPYFTTKQVGEGTGMGLAVVHGIVKSHGGEISVYSEKGKGTTFHIFLPAAEEKSVPEPQPPAPAGGVPRGNERVLVVDDNEQLVKMTTQMLEKLGYHVTGKTSGVAALETFANSPDQFDAIITDQTMPKMTGLQLSKKAKRIKPAIPVILCTGFSESVNKENFENQGADAFLMKPIVMNRIARTLRYVLDKE
jgi:PAS domain S-box-containing protein